METQNRVEPGNQWVLASYIFCCFLFFPLNLESSENVSLYLSYYVLMHGSLIWFELEKEKN